MDVNAVLDDYFTTLVEENFGDELDTEEKNEAKEELFASFNKLFNAKMIDAFADEDIPEVESYITEGNIDKIPELANSKGIDVAELLKDTMVEFRNLYLPSSEQEQ